MSWHKHLLAGLVGGASVFAFILSCGEDVGSPVHADGGGDCQCTVSGPVAVTGEVAVAGVAKVKTADTDASRIVGGAVRIVSDVGGEKLADGPLILTDLANLDTSVSQALVYIDGSEPLDCNEGLPNVIAVAVHTETHTADTHGARLLVPAGSVLCASKASVVAPTISWSGFRPYE
jgi:hypothetical protein